MSSAKAPNETKSSAEASKKGDVTTLQDVLLPSYQVPMHYSITMHPWFPKEDQFQGSVRIYLKILQPTQHIHVHSLGLEMRGSIRISEKLQEGSAKTASQSRLPVSVQDHTWNTIESYHEDEKFQKLVLKLKHEISAGEYILEFQDFVGVLNDEMMGFYRSKYKNAKGEDCYMASTQFEPCDARRAFPCIDEPDRKATFQVIIIHEEEKTVLSNMPVVGQDQHRVHNGKEYVRTIFETTKQTLPTYLIAWVVGDMDYIEDTSTRVKARVYARKGQSHLGKFALGVAVKAISFFEDFFKMPYPEDHLNMVAIPSFSAGAMENSYLFTFREERLLVDEKNVSLASLKATARTTAHETAHSWFGNTATLKWWQYLWLQEGFARFCEHLAVDHIFPEWNIFTEYTSGVLGTALELDSLEAAHPVEVPVVFPEEINEIFDAISYAVGSCLIRMAASWVGMDKFKEGLALYLQRFNCGNARTEDLWDCLEEACQQPIRDTMDAWVKQTGYPLISVDEAEGTHGLMLHIRQDRFLQNGSSDDTLWKVPIWVKARNKDPELIILNGKEGSFELKGVGYNDWVKVNNHQTGMFRVKYSHEMMQKLHKPIKDKTLPPEDRLMIISDAYALARANKIPVSSYLELLSMYSDETDHAVWLEINSEIHDLRALLLSEDNLYPHFQEFLHKLTKKLFSSYGWDAKEGEPHYASEMRNIAIRLQIASGNDAVKREALRRYESGVTIPADLRKTVFATAVEMGKYYEMRKCYENAQQPFDKHITLQAMCASKEPHHIDETLEYMFSDAVRSQDLIYPIAALSYHEISREKLWKYLQNNWEKIVNHIGKGNFLLAGIFKYATRYLQTEKDANDLKAFFEKNYRKNIARTARQAEEKIRIHAGFLKHQMPSFIKFFESHIYTKADM